VAASTAREVDAKASHFSRNEVKNGLLDSIELLESLSNAHNKRGKINPSKGQVFVVEPQEEDEDEGNEEERLASFWFTELDNKLAETLNTVVSEVTE